MIRKLLPVLCVALVASACSDAEPEAAGAVEGGVAGPFPATVRGTVDSSWPMEDGSGRIQLLLLEYPAAGFLVSEATYDRKGMDEEEAEITLTVNPLPAEACGESALQCLEGT